MKIYAICLVKNEADIIAQTLMAAKSWADAVFVYDNLITHEAQPV